MRLEDLKPGAAVKGILPNGLASVGAHRHRKLPYTTLSVVRIRGDLGLPHAQTESRDPDRGHGRRPSEPRTGAGGDAGAALCRGDDRRAVSPPLAPILRRRRPLLVSLL